MALSPTLGRTRKGIFGTTYPGTQQPETPQPMAMAPQGQGLTAPVEHPPRSPSFFGEGGVGRVIAGNIGDAMLQFAQMNPIYAPAMQQRQAMQHNERQRQAKRLEDMEDFRAKRQYERDNPAPTAPINHTDNAGNVFRINPTTGERRLIFHEKNAKRIPQKVFGPNGEEYIEHIEVPNNVNEDGSFRTSGSMGGGPPSSAVEALKANPALREQFDQKYGPGAAERALGGGLSPAGSVSPTGKSISAADFAIMRASLGDAGARAWARRHGINMGGL